MQIHIFTDNDKKIEQNNNHRNHIIWISLYNILTGFSVISSSYGLHHPRLFLRKSSTSVYVFRTICENVTLIVSLKWITVQHRYLRG